MNAWRRFVAVLALTLAGVAPAFAAMEPGNAGSFIFRDTGAFADKPITVHYFRAKDAGPDSPVLIALHGSDRNGRGARDYWLTVARAQRAVVIAPEFDAVQFPDRLYQHGGMDERDPARMTFHVIERLFDHVRSEEGLRAKSYLLFGHSAGAQFVHRLVLTMPQARYSVAVAANAGGYTAPAYPGFFDLRWPAALDESRVPPDALRGIFARRLVVLVGEQDTETQQANLPRSREAAQFGRHRLERGGNFFERARAEATRLGAPFAWELRTVPGVAHNGRRMAQAAAPLLFPTGS